jgi:hypothetical protein
MQIFEGSSHVNVSHVIHELSFGPKYPGIHNPLDETSRILHDTSGTFKYYIKVSCIHLAFVIKHVHEKASKLQHLGNIANKAGRELGSFTNVHIYITI